MSENLHFVLCILHSIKTHQLPSSVEHRAFTVVLCRDKRCLSESQYNQDFRNAISLLKYRG